MLSASGKARVKKDKITKPKTLCPTGETACPIVGSSSFEGAVKQLSAVETSSMMGGSGGCALLVLSFSSSSSSSSSS